MKLIIGVLFVSLLLICIPCQGKRECCKTKTEDENCEQFQKCTGATNHLVIVDSFNAVIRAKKYANRDKNACIVFLNRNESQPRDRKWPQITTRSDNQTELLLISNWHIKQNKALYVLQGNCTNGTDLKIGSSCTFNKESSVIWPSGLCKVKCVKAGTICKPPNVYDENYCKDSALEVKDKYIINITTTVETCISCNSPTKKPEKVLDQSDIDKLVNVTLDFEEGKELDPAQAAGLMNVMDDIASSMNGSSAALTLGEGVTGVLVRETNPKDVNEVSFAYGSQNDSMSIIENKDDAAPFSRSVTVPKEAFDKAVSLNVSIPFAAMFRFLNMAKDELNSTILGDEVMAVEMGTNITDLTDKISINFRQMKYKGIPSCRSWNGEGARPNWTDDGCETITEGDNITCQCSHLTFFAILMAPPNETISSSDLKSLTIITQAGCGLSMVFLGVVLFMHFLMRRTKASIATRILIHLVGAMFLLNLSFLVNNAVANLKSAMGCQIMAALMHYFMLSTFTWFAVQALHICLQLHMTGKITISRYLLKVSVISWVLPSIVVIVIGIVGKYGEQIIYTSDSDETVSMCWITDSNVHYVVNIGYYSLVFLVTFTTFIIILSWLFCLKRAKPTKVQNDKSGKSIVTIMGLCCMLGISWGFAFFAYGVLQIPAYYIFTVLNSFQGFFLFIYYYNTSHSGEEHTGVGSNSSNSSSTTSTTILDKFENPYRNSTAKK